VQPKKKKKQERKKMDSQDIIGKNLELLVKKSGLYAIANR
jgi:hypothetical protein